MLLPPGNDPTYKSYLLQAGLKSLGFDPGPLDNWWGSKSEGAYQSFLWPSYHVTASVFADPKDVAAFRRCKAQGKSDQACFKVGDNGIGAWGDDTTTSEPQCALPPEVIEERWGSVDAGHNKLVKVSYKSSQVSARLTDRMPHLANIKTAARIDLNPGAAAALGLPEGGMVAVEWSWV